MPYLNKKQNDFLTLLLGPEGAEAAERRMHYAMLQEQSRKLTLQLATPTIEEKIFFGQKKKNSYGLR